jgi:hypothetical protein
MDRLNEDDRVEFSLPAASPNHSRTTLDCYVLAVAGRTIALEAVDKVAALRLPEVVENVLLTFRHGVSLVALKGVLSADAIPGDLRFVAPPTEGLQRTRSTRADVRIPVIVKPAASSTRVSAHTVNMSLSGVLAECDAPLAPGAEVELGLLPAEHEEVLPDGVVWMSGVVRRAAQGLVAIEFDPVSAARHRPFVSRIVIEGRRNARKQTSARAFAGHAAEI